MNNYEMLMERYNELKFIYDELSSIRYELEIYKADACYAWQGGASYELSNKIDIIKQKINVIGELLDSMSQKILDRAELENV